MARLRTRTAVIVGALLLAALALRIAEVERTSYRPINDAGFYLSLASSIAHIGDFPTSTQPGTGVGGTRGPSAYFAPGFPYFLAFVDLIDGHTAAHDAGAVQPARIAQAVLGTLTVALIGLVALEAFGSLVGLIALVLAAIYPVFIELSGTLVAENLMTPLILAGVYAALRARGANSQYRWTALAGLFTGLATLTHENAALIVIPLIALVWTGRGRLSRRGLAAPALLLGVAVLTVAPWTIRNATELHRFIPVTDETGVTLVGTYNAASADNQAVPYKWQLYFGIPGEQALVKDSGSLTEPALGSKLQSRALHYISAHPTAPLAAAYHNSRRLLELEGSYAWKVSAASIGLPLGTARIGVVSFWVLGLFALLGAFTRAARRAPPWLWVAPVLLWLSVALVNAETPRFREPIDPFFIALAACALAAAAARLRLRRRGSAWARLRLRRRGSRAT